MQPLNTDQYRNKQLISSGLTLHGGYPTQEPVSPNQLVPAAHRWMQQRLTRHGSRGMPCSSSLKHALKRSTWAEGAVCSTAAPHQAD